MSALVHLVRAHRLQAQAHAAEADYFAERDLLANDAQTAEFYRGLSTDYTRMADELEFGEAEEAA